MRAESEVVTPYRGLMPFEEADAPIFFGRESERDLIAANLIASRLTILYGPSGVGKTSVLEAGVAHALRAQGRRALADHGRPDAVVVSFRQWRDDPVPALIERVREAVADAAPSPAVMEGGTLVPLGQTLDRFSTALGSELLIILDQFEEYLLYHGREDGPGTFAAEFPRAVNRTDLRVNFLLGIREDALAKLDRFKGRIPELFSNYLRLDYLDREAARAAVERPLTYFNRSQPPDGEVRIEPALVEAVLDQVRVGEVVVGQHGRGRIQEDRASGDGPSRVDTPYLQVVMSRLWDEEQRAGSRLLRLETLRRLGGAQQIVRTHLDSSMATLQEADREMAARVFHYLVTPSGTKIAHTVGDLAEYAELPESDVAPVLDRLARSRIVRPVVPPSGQPAAVRYEIFHDVLSPAILDWQARYRQQAFRLLPALAIGLAFGTGASLCLLALGLIARLRGMASTLASDSYLESQAAVLFLGAILAAVTTALRLRRRPQFHGFVAALTASVIAAGAIVLVSWLLAAEAPRAQMAELLLGMLAASPAVAALCVAGLGALRRWMARERALAAEPPDRRRVVSTAGILLGTTWASGLAAFLLLAGGTRLLGVELDSGSTAASVLLVSVALLCAGAGPALAWAASRRPVAKWRAALVGAGWLVTGAVAFLPASFLIKALSLPEPGPSVVGLAAIAVHGVLGGLLTGWQSRQAARAQGPEGAVDRR